MARQKEKVVLVPCEFSRAGIPVEVIFHIMGSRGGNMRGVAPVEYCYGSDKKPLRTEIKPGAKVAGFVTGVTVGGETEKGVVRVNLPDGDIYDLKEDLLVPAKDFAHVPVES